MIEVFGLERGPHELTVVFGDGEHRRIHPAASVTTTVDIAGPVVRASAPDSVPAGEPVTLEVAVEGVEVTAADCDTSGDSAHACPGLTRSVTAWRCASSGVTAASVPSPAAGCGAGGGPVAPACDEAFTVAT